MVRCGSLNNLTASVRFASARDMSPCLLLCWPHCMHCRPPPSPRLKLLQSHKAIIPLGLPPASCSGVANVLRSCPLGERPAFLGCNGPLLRPPWFPLFLYSQLGCGPVSLLVPRGCIITDLPDVLKVRCPQPTVYRRQCLWLRLLNPPHLVVPVSVHTARPDAPCDAADRLRASSQHTRRRAARVPPRRRPCARCLRAACGSSRRIAPPSRRQRRVGVLRTRLPGDACADGLRPWRSSDRGSGYNCAATVRECSTVVPHEAMLLCVVCVCVCVCVCV